MTPKQIDYLIKTATPVRVYHIAAPTEIATFTFVSRDRRRVTTACGARFEFCDLRMSAAHYTI